MADLIERLRARAKASGGDKLLEEAADALAAMGGQGEDDAWCAECGVKLELVRPGKHQHPTCSQATPTPQQPRKEGSKP